jgi:hypothetical protein
VSDETHRKEKRGAKRYPYIRSAICVSNTEQFEVQILNISSTGIQFASRTDIEVHNTLQIKWKDSKFGEFHPSLIIARRIHQPDNVDYQYYYGSQYCNLDDQTKVNLVTLLKAIKDYDKKKDKVDIEKITTHYLFDVIDKDASFLKKLLDGSEYNEDFESILMQVKDYEREAFRKSDAGSLCIQELTTCNFHCNLLSMLLPFMVEKGDLRIQYFGQILKQLDLFVQLEDKTDKAIKKAMEENPVLDRIALQKFINESSNRLFYNKQSLLQLVVETFGTVASESTEYNEMMTKIKAEHAHLAQITENTGESEMLTYKRRTKKIDEAAQKVDVLEVPVINQSGPNYTIWVGVFFILLLSGSIGATYYFDYKETNAMKKSIDIPLEIYGFEKMGTQIDVRVSAQEWSKLPEDTKKNIIEKLIRIAQKDKTARTVTLMSTDRKIIKTLYESMLPVPEGQN